MRGGFYLDGHASGVGLRFLSCDYEDRVKAGGLVKEDPKDNYLFQGLKDCIDRVTGNAATPLTVTACAGWSSRYCKRQLPFYLGRPLVSAIDGCCWQGRACFARTDGKFHTFPVESPVRLFEKLIVPSDIEDTGAGEAERADPFGSGIPEDLPD
ncbi:MAG: hypothetical protein R3B54_07155 [Bdellovibrionota bacterium]